MAMFVLMGALAAWGFLCALWAALGWLLPDGRGCALVCVGQPDMGIVSRWKWLKGLGLLRCPLIAITEDPHEDSETEQCSRENLLFRLEMERNRFNGTGNGNYPGRHQRRDISEL